VPARGFCSSRTVRASSDRILTTHAGSLPRPPALRDLHVLASRREPVDAAALASAVDAATRAVVARQLDVGIDVGNDGEQGRESFFTYVQHRLSGFGGIGDRPVMRDITQFASFLKLRLPDFARTMVSLVATPRAVGDVRHADRAPLERECARLRACLAAEQRTFAEPFMTAPSPGIVAAAMQNAHYASFAEYLAAVGKALRVEYEYIAAQGFVLQIDAPDLAMERHTAFADRPLDEFLAFIDAVVATINTAL